MANSQPYANKTPHNISMITVVNLESQIKDIHLDSLVCAKHTTQCSIP